ncbi:SMC-Scp complex subunit ScpB [Candidatus Nomurabacteria bacterium]|nr:SMC-Scp complex subunit ScpB [Candidatus Nomurabacteria bacterium]
MNLESKIEAILFWKGEPVSSKRLQDILKVSKEEILNAISKLKENLANRGVALVEKDGEFTLGTAPELTQIIENLQKEELNKELSKASLETLSIVLYKSGVSRAEIDYIRGVNSSFTLRALSVRGLIERTEDPKDHRRFIYKPNFELMSYMGIKSIEELPDYMEVKNSMDIVAKNLENFSDQEAGESQNEN